VYIVVLCLVISALLPMWALGIIDPHVVRWTTLCMFGSLFVCRFACLVLLVCMFCCVDCIAGYACLHVVGLSDVCWLWWCDSGVMAWYHTFNVS
jgi:hypothetical protein